MEMKKKTASRKEENDASATIVLAFLLSCFTDSTLDTPRLRMSFLEKVEKHVDKWTQFEQKM